MFFRFVGMNFKNNNRNLLMKQYITLGLAASSLLLTSCVGVATGVGVAAGTAAVQEGGISRALSDARIQTEINDLWFRHDVSMFAKLDLTINQGRVLITGVVQNSEQRVEAVRLAWLPAGVLQVINEIKVADSAGVMGFAKDTWITTRLRSALVLDKNVESINYSIDTVQGTVYLMGFAQNQVELNHVMNVARTIENVKQVVSYVKLVGAPEVTSQGGAANSQSTDPNAGVVMGASSDPIQWDQESVYE